MLPKNIVERETKEQKEKEKGKKERRRRRERGETLKSVVGKEKDRIQRFDERENEKIFGSQGLLQ